MPALRLTATIAILVAAATTHAVEPSSRVLQRFDAPEAVQAVAVDDAHFYAIANTVIGKYDKQTGELVTRWKASEQMPLKHMNAGIVIDSKLYCAHSNYPHFPEASSIEIFDAATLEHVGNHSLGIYEGSLTWIDWHDDAWWAVFAHYSNKVNDDPFAKPHTFTSLVKFDRQWRRMAGWTFPDRLLDLFAPQSCSGGGWGPDGHLYCTGHDRAEVYQLELPRAGSTLVIKQTIPVEITGQGIAWDKSRPGVLYGISRPKKQVVALRVLVEQYEQEARGWPRQLSGNHSQQFGSMIGMLFESLLARVLPWYPYVWGVGLLIIVPYSFLHWRRNPEVDWLKRAAFGSIGWSVGFAILFGLSLAMILIEAQMSFDTAIGRTPGTLVLRHEGSQSRIVDEGACQKLATIPPAI